MSAWQIKSGNNDAKNIFKASQTGSANGLRLLLNADIDHYLYTTGQVGWRLLIHNQTESPFPEEKSVAIAPGTSTYIGMKLSTAERLSSVTNYIYTAKYSECVDADNLQEDAKNNAYSNLMEVAYSQSACLKTCYQQEVIKVCHCFDFAYPNTGSAFSDLDKSWRTTACSYKNTTLCEANLPFLFSNGKASAFLSGNCKIGIWAKYIDNQLTCDCPNTCT